MSTSRTRVAAVVAALALGGGAIALSLAAHNRGAGPGANGSPSSTPDSSSSPTTSAASTGPAARGPVPPAAGAWVGAWVKPSVPTQAGRVDAVAGFEAEIGRPLAVVHIFHKWTDEFPTQADTALAA